MRSAQVRHFWINISKIYKSERIFLFLLWNNSYNPAFFLKIITELPVNSPYPKIDKSRWHWDFNIWVDAIYLEFTSLFLFYLQLQQKSLDTSYRTRHEGSARWKEESRLIMGLRTQRTTCWWIPWVFCLIYLRLSAREAGNLVQKSHWANKKNETK